MVSDARDSTESNSDDHARDNRVVAVRAAN